MIVKTAINILRKIHTSPENLTLISYETSDVFVIFVVVNYLKNFMVKNVFISEISMVASSYM